MAQIVLIMGLKVWVKKAKQIISAVQFGASAQQIDSHFSLASCFFLSAGSPFWHEPLTFIHTRRKQRERPFRFDEAGNQTQDPHQPPQSL